MKNTLEIFIITYNRKAHLERTLQALLRQDSPVKDVSITVLDNCSTDGTGELLARCVQQHPTVRHLRHHRNIGSNANIARSFELASKPYVWVLADDDCYDFSHWREVEEALAKQYDLIIVNREGTYPQTDLLKTLRRTTFLPACIFKTALIDDTAMRNIYDHTSTWFPHLALLCKVINEHKSVCFCEHNAVLQANRNQDDYAYLRVNPDLSPAQQYTFFDVGYLNCLEMIQDKKTRAEAVNWFTQKPGFFRHVKGTFKKNRIFYHNYSRNLTGPWAVLTTWQRIQFALAILFDDICYFLKYPKYRKYKQKK